MITSKYFLNKTFLILGMGITGQSLAKSLKKSGGRVLYWDDNDLVRKKIINQQYLQYNDTSFNKEKIDFIIPSPGIPTLGKNQHKIISKSKKFKCKIICELDLFQIYLDNFKNNEETNIKVIAVTGTNGKSTTVSLIHHILKSNNYKSSLIGNIGKSIFDAQVFKKGYYVIEVSSYQLESSKIFSPDISVILNFSSDHLSRHKTLKNYLNQKLKILKNKKHNHLTVINNNHRLLKAKSKKMIESISSDMLLFDFDKKLLKTYLKNNKSILKKTLEKIPTKKNNSLIGEHSQQNIHMALSILEYIGINKKNIIKSIWDFKGLPHRQEIVYEDSRVRIINDSKATNFNSMIPALRNYSNIYLICGGLIKNEKIKILEPYLKNIKKVYVTGKEKNIFFNYFKKSHITIYSHKLFDIIKKINEDIEDKEKIIILFCPGAASFDQFKNFEVRGIFFKKIIKKIFLK